MDRRHLVAALAASALVPGLARAAASQRVPLADAFLLLADYLALAPGKRDRFHPAYLARRGPKPAADAQAAMVAADGTRTAFVFGPDGLVANLPTLDQLKSNATFEMVGLAFGFALELRGSAAPAARYALADLTAALAQVNAAESTFVEGGAVGQLAFIYFPDAGAGQVTFADGHAAPLSVFTLPGLGPVAYLEPRSLTGAAAVVLDKPPSRVMFAGPPRRS